MLEVEQVSKIYSENAGVRDICFTLGSGEIVSIIGPNGSGKTTLLNMIAGILKADKGKIALNNMDIEELETRKQIGYLPDTISVNPRIKVIDLLHMVSDYKFNGMFKEEIEKNLITYHLDTYRDQKFGNLSMGIKKKVGILIVFMGAPNLIILDEPTNGMDTHGILQLKNNILEAKEKGSTILISSHILDFVNSIVDKSLFLKDMKLDTIVSNKENLEDIYKRLYL